MSKNVHKIGVLIILHFHKNVFQFKLFYILMYQSFIFVIHKNESQLNLKI